ncbi:flagellar hook protein FlgE [Sphingomonas nostoxanthinifaciens]|uniref:flagellar hook protein FlgE n=1 Tax=Sphingomonas nostoxanthinifaciens TaxID=2872652 RepID=UPI001CC201A3|nr:flagellar hook protein FlgE [Sphingomonas nostoxanthinifaciens]UAK26058.1 flagellar hook protein FlgE [Sphingomonas nostoxanthinifaciens]
MSFFTSLSGLKGAQSDLGVISNNIANVGSIGFKKSRAEFGDLISASPLQSGTVAGQGTRLKDISQQFTQGGFQTSDRALDLAISGQGFFVTKTGSTLAYTRNGAFSLDGDRYLVDSNGAYVQVLPVDSSGTLAATGLSSATNLQIPQTAGSPVATSAVQLGVTLPSNADMPSARSNYSTTTPYAFSRYDSNSYNFSTSTTVFDSSGNPQQATLYYVRTSVPDTTATPPVTDSTWQAHLFVGDQEASADGSAVTTPAQPVTMTFDSNGVLKSPTTGTQFSSVLPSGAGAPMSIDLTFDSSNTRQASSTFTPGTITQNGKAAGQLNNISVDSNGLVSATFSDGTSKKLGAIMIANFPNTNGLRQLGDSRWGQSGLSGDPIISQAGSGSAGSIQSGALEEANVDLTEELVSLITAQRNFSANSKAIETGNNMTQTIINLR